uniref:C2 domain-containing protein n=1 Tax=Bursaphelenchus xylophilus TaxID=6326 RepID=A0A1I7SKK3_BURXY
MLFQSDNRPQFFNLPKLLGDLHPYVHVEVDEPPQKFFTVGASGANPNWNDETELIINDNSDEVLIEIFGASGPKRKDNDKFLGLAIVGVNELKSSLDNVHHLQLQSRPYQNDRVSGSLTIQ